jgi:RNA polymerase sigma factor
VVAGVPSVQPFDDELWRLARAGDRHARERLLEACQPFVVKVVSRVTGRFLTRGEDEEVAIGLIALSEAIDHFDSTRGANFFTFAEVVIRRRLIDHYRRAARRHEVPLSAYLREEELEAEEPRFARLASVEAWRQQEEREARRLEVEAYQEELLRLGLTLGEVAASCPQHADARRLAQRLARLVVEDPVLKEALFSTGRLPVQELVARGQVSRKTVERQRKYIVAVAVALAGPYEHLHEYLKGGG